jgi:hypothetical protein
LLESLSSDDPREVAGYQIRARLGTGGMGRVYLARTPGGRRVALKVVRAEYGDDEQFRARFRQEVAAAQRVHGLFTAQVLDADPDAPQPWLATSYVPGLSLREAVTEYGPLPANTAFLLIAGIAEALQAIHAAGIVHRDLKPSNVILAADGPRVIDFGIARSMAAPALTRTGSRVGSPRFMAPEQARGQPATPAADVFALGSVAMYAAAGHPPFGTDDAVAVLNRVLYEAPDLDGCPAGLRPLIEGCLAKDPVHRPRPGDIIRTCRDRVGGSLAFERSWLPAQLAAAAVDAGPVPSDLRGLGPGSGEPGAADPESTFSGEGSYPSAGALPVGRLNGEVGHAPDPPAGDGAGQVSSGRPWPGSRPAGARNAHARPGGRRRSKQAVLGSLAVGLAIVVAASATIALLPAPADQASSQQHRSRAVGPPTAAASTHPKHHASRADGAPGQSAHPTPQPSASGARSRPGSSPHQTPPSPPPVRRSPTPAPTGQAAFAGTWSGTVSQPTWPVPSWTLQLVIPATGQQGSYNAPSLGCSGNLYVSATAGNVMTAVAQTTHGLSLSCVLLARLTLTLTSSSRLSVIWVPTGRSNVIGTAVLARG